MIRCLQLALYFFGCHLKLFRCLWLQFFLRLSSGVVSLDLKVCLEMYSGFLPLARIAFVSSDVFFNRHHKVSNPLGSIHCRWKSTSVLALLHCHRFLVCSPVSRQLTWLFLWMSSEVVPLAMIAFVSSGGFSCFSICNKWLWIRWFHFYAFHCLASSRVFWVIHIICDCQCICFRLPSEVVPRALICFVSSDVFSCCSFSIECFRTFGCLLV